MTQRIFILIPLLLCTLLVAACGVKESGLSTYSYQPESPAVISGHNLYQYDALNLSTSQRVNQFSRSTFMHGQQQEFVRRLTAAQALDKEAQKLGREPGSLFRQ